eukprot:1906769-Amphidinium_carterae.1
MLLRRRGIDQAAPVDQVMALESEVRSAVSIQQRLFQDHLASILRAGGFEQSTAEKCLFIHRPRK